MLKEAGLSASFSFIVGRGGGYMNKRTCIIVLHEIYGVNNHMAYYRQVFEQQQMDVYIPNLLNRTTVFMYDEEEKAYEYFMEAVGFEKAKKIVEQLIDALAKQYDFIQLVGFSVGATVAWLCSEHPAVQKVLCFYGSRIRSYTNVIPKVPVQMVFGKNEKAFSPENVRIGLSEHPLVTFEIVEGTHGFANPYDQMYREQTTKRVLQQWFDLK